MKTTALRLSIAVAAAAVIAACSSGSTGSSTAVPNPVSTNPAIATVSSTETGLQVTFTVVRNANKQIAGATSEKRPQFVSPNTYGLKVTIAPDGGTAKTYNYEVNNTLAVCHSDALYGSSFACTFRLPTLGTTETVTIMELDQVPTGTIDPITALGSGDFPSNTAVLAVGSARATFVPATLTTVAIALNPIVGLWVDGGLSSASAGVGESARRLVVTGDRAGNGTLTPTAADFEANVLVSPALLPGGPLVPQLFVDVNGSPTQILLTASNTTAFTFLPLPGVNTSGPLPTPPPTGAYALTALIPDTSFSGAFTVGLSIGFQYSGTATPSPTGGTLTFDNQLTALTPVFTGAPFSAEIIPTPNYRTTITYILAPVFAAPATIMMTHNTFTTVTGYDPGMTFDMNRNDCFDSSNAIIATVASGGPHVNGQQPFTLSARSVPGTCTFVLSDTATGIRTNAVTVTVL